MDPQPTPTPAAGPAATAAPVTEFVRTDRRMAGYILLGLSVAFLAATIFLAVRSFKIPAAEPDKAAEKAPDPFNPEPPKLEIANPNRPAYTVGWVATLAGFLVTAGVGAWLVAGLPAPDVGRQRTEARVALLAAGGGLGVLLILAGVAYFYLWSDSLTAWLSRDETKQAPWAIGPLLGVVLGAGLIFAAIQPARAEERNNTLLRRLVYGGNFALTVLLLFVALVVANVAFAIRVPNRLDTTATGFYTLSEPTREFLAQLDQPVTAHAILPESAGDRVSDDIRRLLQSCQDASSGKFRVKFINPTLSKTELATLRAKYTQLEINDVGVLLTVGDDDKATRYTFLRVDEFLDRDAAAMGRQSQPVFAGEAKLMRELMFLAENKNKPVVYFTQSNGELDVGGERPGGEPVGEEHSGTQLKAYLEKNYLDVRPLKFDPLAPKVPDDADVIVVAAPRTVIGAPAAEALKKYMAEPRPGGKKGKMIVMAGAPLPQESRKVTPTGLEPLLKEFNVTLGDKYVFGMEGREMVIGEMPVGFSQGAARSRNSIVLTLRNHPPTLVLPREVSVAPGGAPTLRATPLLLTLTDLTWLEDEYPQNDRQMMAELQRNARLKQLSESPRPVMAVVSEADAAPGASGGTARLAVIGSGMIGSNAWASRVRGTAPVEFDLIGATVDWLRDRPPVPAGITTKTYTAYAFPAKVDSTRLLWLPLGLAVLTVVALGTGVWVIRRK